MRIKVAFKYFGAVLLACMFAWAVRAQEPPTAFGRDGRTVRLLVGFAAGGTNDILARAIAPKLSDALGVSVVVENRPGANGVIAAGVVAQANPDGHTLLFSFAGTFAQTPHMMLKQPYDVFKDFTPISLAAQGPQVLVAWTGLPVHDVRELIAYAKSRPGQLSISSSGTGTSTDIYAEILMRNAGIQLLHVPYKGAGEVTRDLFSGTVPLTFTAAPTAVQFMASGRVRMLGVTAAARSPILPDVPTMTEQGVPGLDMVGWQGFFGPPHMAAATVQTLNQAIAKALADPQVKGLIAKSLWEAKSSTPEELARLVDADYHRWGAIMKGLGIKAE
jgi:tripartite-type tricarboxylate transporter receptor subunit TctC